VEIIDLKMKGSGRQGLFKKVTSGLAGLWRLYRLMRQGNFDVVQTFTHYSNILGPFIAWLAGVRVRVSSQRSSLKGVPSWVLSLDRLVTNSSLVDAMVTVSEGTRQFSIEREGLNPKKLFTIHNGINIQRFAPAPTEQVEALRSVLGLPETATVVLTIARLHPQKGHRFLLQAVPEILQVYPDTHFLFVGEGELRQELEAMTQQLGVQDAVHFLGVRQD